MKSKRLEICRKSCAVTIQPNAIIMAKIESEFRHLSDYKNSHSLLKKYLTEELFNTIKNRVTVHGSTLLDVILSGVENIDSIIGVYAPDGQSYKIFYELFDQIIKEYHHNDKHPAVDFGFVNKIINVDNKDEHMLSIKISCNRSLCGYPFNRRLTEKQLKKIETRVREGLLSLDRNYRGQYFALIDKKPETRKQLITENYLFHNHTDKFLDEAIGNRFWPIGRGFFFNTFKNFWVWINIEEHLSIISIERGSNLGACYRRLVIGLKKVGHLVSFLHDEKLGFLNFCPTNLGTGMQISAQIRLKNLLKHRPILDKIALRYHLFVDVACGENCSSYICTVVFKSKLGMNEFQTVQWMQNAILDIIRADIHL